MTTEIPNSNSSEVQHNHQFGGAADVDDSRAADEFLDEQFFKEEERWNAALKAEIAADSSSQRLRLGAGVLLAREAGAPQPEFLTRLTILARRFEKDSDTPVLDPDTGRQLTALQLQEEMGAPQESAYGLSQWDREFSRRRGYPDMDIRQFDTFVNAYQTAVRAGAREDDLQYAMHVAGGTMDVPPEIVDRAWAEEARIRNEVADVLVDHYRQNVMAEEVRGGDRQVPVEVLARMASTHSDPAAGPWRAQAYAHAETQDAQDWYAAMDPELCKAFALRSALSEYARTTWGNRDVRERFMASQDSRLAKQLESGRPLPEVRIRHQSRSRAPIMVEAEQE